MRPEGRPLKLTDASGKVLSCRWIAAGESFTSLQATEELTCERCDDDGICS